MRHLNLIIGSIINHIMVALLLEKEGIIKGRLKLEYEGLNLVIGKKLMDTGLDSH